LDNNNLALNFHVEVKFLGNLDSVEEQFQTTTSTLTRDWNHLPGFVCWNKAGKTNAGNIKDLTLRQCKKACLDDPQCIGVLRFSNDSSGKGLCMKGKTKMDEWLKCSNDSEYDTFALVGAPPTTSADDNESDEETGYIMFNVYNPSIMYFSWQVLRVKYLPETCEITTHTGDLKRKIIKLLCYEYWDKRVFVYIEGQDTDGEFHHREGRITVRDSITNRITWHPQPILRTPISSFIYYFLYAFISGLMIPDCFFFALDFVNMWFVFRYFKFLNV